MEFAVTTAMMAILAATAAPKLSMLSENAKMQKSRNELDKISRQALSFFQERASIEGRGRFPGQEKYDGLKSKLSIDVLFDISTSYSTKDRSTAIP